jgi:hypothetical protein
MKINPSTQLLAAALTLALAPTLAAQTIVMPSGSYRIHAVASGAGASSGEGQSGSGNDVKDELFEGTKQFEKNASEVTEINMDPETLNLVHGRDSSAAQRTLLKVVRTYEYDKPGMYDMAAVDAIRNRLSTGDWRCPIHTRELKSGESTDVCYKRRSDGYEEKAIVTVEPKELTFIHTIEKRGPGQGELSDLPFIPGMGILPMTAMIDPDTMINLQTALHLNLGDQAIDLSHLSLQMKDFQKNKNLNLHIDGKQMEQLQRQLRELTPPEAPDSKPLE